MGHPVRLPTVARALLSVPWEAPSPDDISETLAQASDRLGLALKTLMARAHRAGLPLAPQGRPRKGTTWTHPQRAWDRAAQIHDPAPGEWTRPEDARLRRLTKPPARGRLRLDWPALLAALPRHAKGAIQARRAALGLTRAPTWPPAQVEVLRRKFGRVSRALMLAMLPGRSWAAIVKLAKAEGVAGLPCGHMAVSTAARKFGYHVATFLDLLTRHRVRVRVYTCTQGPLARVPWKIVSVAACDRAVRADFETETVAVAAARIGVPRKTLRSWMIAAGHPMEGRRGQWQRFPSATLDTVARSSGHRAGGESIGHAARRHGMEPTRLRQWLRAAGLVTPTLRGHRQWLDPQSVDGVVNAGRAASVERGRGE